MTIKELIDTYGLVQIAEQTKISKDNLLNLLNEDYTVLNKANALGFLKIIEREYDVDLSEHRARIKQTIEDDTYVPKELLLTEKKYGSTKKFASGLVIFVLLFVGLSYVVYLIDFQNGDETQSPQNNVIQEIEEPDIKKFQQPQINMSAVEVSKQAENENAKNEVNATLKYEEIDVVESTKESEKVQETQNKVEQNVQEVQNQTSQADTDALNQKQNDEAKVISVYDDLKEVVIMPRRKLWLGYINLDSGERVQKNKSDQIVIDTNNTIIVTGHGWLEVASKEFRQGERLYFHYKNNQLEQINESAFKKLNEGRVW